MNVRYKTFANRTNQDIRFDQVLRAKPLTTRSPSANTSFVEPVAVSATEFSHFSPRKRVNVVSFTPSCDVQELITKSAEKSVNVYKDSCTNEKSQSNPLYSVSISHSPSVHIPTFCESYHLDNSPYSTTGHIHIPLKRSPIKPVVSSPQPLSASHLMYRNKTSVSTSPSNLIQTSITFSRSFSSGGGGSAGHPTTTRSLMKCASNSATTHSSTHSDSVNKKTVVVSSCTNNLPPSFVNSSHVLTMRNGNINVPGAFIGSSRSNSSTHTSTVMLPATAVGGSELRRTSHSSAPYTKKKRVAYNPRPWQRDIESDEFSPMKQSKTDQTGLSHNHNSTAPIVPADRVYHTMHSPMEQAQSKLENNASNVHSDNSDSLSSHLSCGSDMKTKPHFDFSDSDDDDDETVAALEKHVTQTVMNRAKLPRLSSLIGVTVSEQEARIESKANSNVMTSAGGDDELVVFDASKLREKKDSIANEEEEEEEDEDEEMEDVKPWFCPADRRSHDKSETKDSVDSSKKNKVLRSEKPLYTVVQNVKEAHVCLERGETQHLLDDVHYLVDGLSDRNQVNTRALSVLTLANKCLTPSFRYLVSAHGLTKRICTLLQDAYKDYTLALTSAGLFFVLSRDRNADIFDADSLQVLTRILQAPDSIGIDQGGGYQALLRAKKEAECVRTRVRQLLDGLQRNGRSSAKSIPPSIGRIGGGDVSITPLSGAMQSKRPTPTAISATLGPTTLTAGLSTRHLQMTRQLTASDLVLEAILNLGTRKTGDWFKAGLRESGGLDRVADAAADAVDYLADLDPANCDSHRRRPGLTWRSGTNVTGLDGFALDSLRRVCHYTKLLENMTYMNSDNQIYLVRYRDHLLINRLIRCVRVCASHLPRQNPCIQDTETTTTTTSVVPSIATNDQSILVHCVLGIFRFLVNVSHDEFVSDRLGACPGLLETVLECVLDLPGRLPSNKRFDLLVLTLCLMANLCEHCPENRTRLVHLDIPKPIAKGAQCDQGQKSADPSHAEEEVDDEDEMDSDVVDSQVPQLVPALNELIQLFQLREERARNHDFERDDEEATAAENRRRERNNMDMALCSSDPTKFGHAPTHVEEAGLKWRLIEDRKISGGPRSRRNHTKFQLKCKKKSKRHKRANARIRRGAGSENEDDTEFDEDDCETSDASGFDDDDDEDADENSEEDEDDDDDDDDESINGGADVEFVTDTREEQEQLAERMSQAQQHMEDSVVAAYVALLLGCIIQSSRLYAEKVRTQLPDGQFRPLAIMLAKLLSFLSLTKGVGTSGSETILRIVRVLEAQDKQNSLVAKP